MAECISNSKETASSMDLSAPGIVKKNWQTPHILELDYASTEGGPTPVSVDGVYSDS